MSNRELYMAKRKLINATRSIVSHVDLLLVSELYKLHTNGKLHYDRERLQRLLNRWPNFKMASYLTSLFNGGNFKDLFQIAEISPIVKALDLALNPDSKEYEFVKENLEYFQNLEKQGFEYIVLDGQHRIDTIADFIDGNFDFDPLSAIELKNPEEAGTILVKGKFHTLPQEAQDYFLDQRVVVTTYTTGNLRELANVFITSNDMEPMTEHERVILSYNHLNRWLNKQCINDINLRNMFENIKGMTGEYDLKHKGDTLFYAEMLRYISKNDYTGYNYGELKSMLGYNPGFTSNHVTINERTKQLTAQIFRIMADGCAAMPENNLRKFTKASLYNLFYTISFLMQKGNKWSQPFGIDGKYAIADAAKFVEWFFDEEYARLEVKGTYITFNVPGKAKPKKQVNEWSFRKHNADQNHASKESVKGNGGSKYTFNDWARVRYLVADLNEAVDTLERKGIIRKVGARTGDITRDEALVAARIPLSQAHKYHVDEIVPVSKGGFRNEDNIQVIEADKNGNKSDRYTRDPRESIAKSERIAAAKKKPTKPTKK